MYIVSVSCTYYNIQCMLYTYTYLNIKYTCLYVAYMIISYIKYKFNYLWNVSTSTKIINYF